MGKQQTFILILVFIDILFLATGQLALESSSGLLIDGILNPESFKTLNFWSSFVDGFANALSTLAVLTTVVVGFTTRASDILIFIPLGILLSLMVSDYINIFTYLASFNFVLAVLIFVPFIIMYGFVVIEWVRGKE